MSEIEVESTEEWRPVVGYEGLYSVSNLGRVRRDAPGKGTYPGRLLKPGLSPKGYERVKLTKDGVDSLPFVHCLVAYAFLGPRPEGMETAHWNGIKTDNRLKNLRYATRSDNQLDGHRQGKRVTCQNLSMENVSDIRYLLKAGYKVKDLAFAFKCSEATIYGIKNGTRWTHRLDQSHIEGGE